MDLLKITGLNLEKLASDEYQQQLEEIEKAEAEEIEKLKLRDKLSYYRDVSRSGVNARYHNESIETYHAETENEKRNKKAVQDFINGKTRQMLLFIGQFGTGKTHLGCSIIREKGGRFISSFELCTRYEMGADFNAKENRLEVLQYFSEIEMLVIDEIGRGKPEIEKQILPYIINQRYENLKPLVLITNLEKEKFIELLGGATVDRLKEICSTLTFTGDSKRCHQN